MTTTLNQNIVAELIEPLPYVGGATVNPRGGRVPADGYMVGVAGRGIVVNMVDGDVYREVLAWLTNTSFGPNEYAGSWLDLDLAYFDVSCRVDALGDALALAGATGELAVWDIANACEVTV